MISQFPRYSNLWHPSQKWSNLWCCFYFTKLIHLYEECANMVFSLSYFLFSFLNIGFVRTLTTGVNATSAVAIPGIGLTHLIFVMVSCVMGGSILLYIISSFMKEYVRPVTSKNNNICLLILCVYILTANCYFLASVLQ